MDPTTHPPGNSTDAAAPGPPAPDLSGKTLGDFQLLRRLGQGGMGQVYLAEQRSLKRQVALKILRADLAMSTLSLQRFKAEGEAVARATHANIVQVYAIGEAQGLHYMALEYVEGRNLREYLARKGPPDLASIVSIMRQVAAALQRAGELGLVHRDIKPDNILLTRKGDVKVADFGLSRCLTPDQQPLHLTQSGVTMGTPLYMSPEQVEGKPLDHRADIYSFGVTCYHLIAGEPPFQGSNAFEVALKHTREEARPLHDIRPDLPPELSAIVHKMIAKDPAQRYQTCRELLRDLTRLREGLAGVKTETVGALTANSGSVVAASRQTAVVPVRSPARLRWMAAASLVAALAGGVALGMWYRAVNTIPEEQPNSSEEGSSEEFFKTQKEREKFFLDSLKHFANPANRDDREMGLKHRLSLGLIYLNQWRLDDADKFFQDLIRNPHKVPEYTLLGRVGQAIVLGLRNQAKESNQKFLDLVNEKGADSLLKNQTLLFNAELRLWIAKALEYNTLNAEKQNAPFPEKLRVYREPPRAQAPPVRDKPGKKP
jgi:eukaryotic-like serine/threonine-protein kinase